MPRILKKGDWGHSTFEAFADPNNTLDAKNIIITGAVCICLDSNSKIVLTHHRNGNFDLIGGKCEKGETPVETLKREALEEAGVELTSWKYFGYYKITQKDTAPYQFKNKYPKESYILFYIANGVKTREPYGEEIDFCKAFTVDELFEERPLEHEMLWEALRILGVII